MSLEEGKEKGGNEGLPLEQIFASFREGKKRGKKWE